MLLCWIWLSLVLYYLMFRYGYAAYRYAVYGEEKYGKLATGYTLDIVVVSHILPLLSIKSTILCSLSALLVLFVLLFLADNYEQDWRLQQKGFPFQYIRRS